jgi:hypothetical protein
MERLITQAPIQVRGDTVNRHERIFPLLVAESIMGATEKYTGKEQRRVDIWNTVGLKIDHEYNKSQGYDSREDYVGDLISQRYKILKDSYDISSDNRFIVRDDDKEVKNIISGEVGRLIKVGKMAVELTSYKYCSDCERVIAPSEAPIDSCPVNKEHRLKNQDKNGLSLIVNDEFRKKIISSTRLSCSQAAGQLLSSVNNLPNKIQASKQREHGISLVEYGVDGDFVLDPLIALSMMNTVLIKKGIGRISNTILGRDTLKKYVPYVMLTENGDDVDFTVTGLVPPYSIDSKDDFYFPHLPLIMSSRMGDVSKGQLEGYKDIHRKMKRKFESTLYILNDLSTREGYVQDNNPHNEWFQTINGLLDGGKIQQASLEFRRVIYDDISREYVNLCKSEKFFPNERIVKSLEELYSIFYEQ